MEQAQRVRIFARHVANQVKREVGYSVNGYKNEWIDLARGQCVPEGYRVDRQANGAWMWQDIDNLQGTATWEEYDTEQEARRGAWSDLKARALVG